MHNLFIVMLNLMDNLTMIYILPSSSSDNHLDLFPSDCLDY